MVDEARLALKKVRVDGRAADVYVFDDRFVVTTGEGDQVIPLTRLDRIATRKSWRGAKLLLAWDTGHVMKIRRVSPSTASAAHRTIVTITRSLH